MQELTQEVETELFLTGGWSDGSRQAETLRAEGDP